MLPFPGVFRCVDDVALFLVITALVFFFCGALCDTAEAAPVKIYLEGHRLETDVPPKIVNDRTLVPLRFVAEALGARVRWNSESRRVTIERDGESMVLTIGDKRAVFGKTEWVMDVEPKIIEGRTMVPVRFVAEALGLAVEWDGEERAVLLAEREFVFSGYRWLGGQGAGDLLLMTDGPAPFKLWNHDPRSKIDSVTRLLLDLKRSRLGDFDRSLVYVGKGGVSLLRLAEVVFRQKRARFAVDFSGPTTVEVKRPPDRQGLVLTVHYRLTGIEQDLGTSGACLTLKTSGPPRVKEEFDEGEGVLKLTLPQLTVDPGVEGRRSDFQAPVEFVKVIAPQEGEDGQTRVLVGVEEEVGPDDYSLEAREEGLQIYFHNTITAFKHRLEEDSLVLRTESRYGLSYSVFRLQDPPRVVVDFPYTRLSAPSQEIEVEGWGKIRYAQLQSDPPVARLVLETREPVFYGRVTTPTQLKEGILELRASRSPVGEEKIVVDAGHGGYDPGAIGFRGRKKRISIYP